MRGIVDNARYRELRLGANLSVRQLAKAIDVSPTYISQVETGKISDGYSRTTTMRMLIAIKAKPEVARELLNPWLTFHRAEVLAIETFINEVKA